MFRSLFAALFALGLVVLLGADVPRPSEARASQVVSGLGVARVQGGDALVEIFVAVPAGRDAAEAVRLALADQGARPITAQEFKASGLVWEQFSDADAGNNYVTQNYNGAGDPTGGAGRLALGNTQTTWTEVTSSSFALRDGGNTTRCPSLVRECPGPQVFDGFNDVGWKDLGRCRGSCTLGVTWYGTSTDEADIALNTRVSWRTDGGNYDVESVLLHENGHVAGLSHSSVQAAVMYAYYQGVRRVLHQDDIDGISSLYHSP